MGDSRRPPAVPIPDPETADRAELYRALEASVGSAFSSDPLAPNPNPLIIVISGPSGVGKDAVIKRLREVREGIHFVVTATSRAKREGEVDGKDYFFVSKEEFLSMVQRDELLEYAMVYGDYKGIDLGRLLHSLCFNILPFITNFRMPPNFRFFVICATFLFVFVFHFVAMDTS